MKKFLLFVFTLVFAFSNAFSHSYDTYTYVIGDFELCEKNFTEKMPKNEMLEVGYRVFSNKYENLPAGSYEFLIEYYSVFYGFECIDSEKSTPGCFAGKTTYTNKYSASQSIGFTLDSTATVTIKFDRNTNKIAVISTSSFVNERPFYYVNYSNAGNQNLKKIYMGVDDGISFTMPFAQGSSSIRIAQNYNSPLHVNFDCTNFDADGSDPIQFFLSEETEVTVNVVDGHVCLSIPTPVVETDSIDSDFIDYSETEEIQFE